MSENNAKIIIENSQSSEEGNEVFSVEEPCKFMVKGENVYILYKNDGVTSKIKIEGKTVTVTRMGEFSSEMIYREGETTSFLYKMPYGTLDMELKTEKAEVNVSEAGGEIVLNYTLSFSGMETKNGMKIKIEK